MSEPIQSIAQNNYILQAPPPTATMFTTELEYDGDKISGYAGSAFKAGTDLEFGYDSADNISAINNSALTDVSLNNIVQTNSGAWGGSALPISAGPGVKVNLVDNTLVFSNDETVLYSATPKSYGGTSSGETIQLNETIANFERLRFYVNVTRRTSSEVNTTFYEPYEIENYNNTAADFQFGPFPENNVTANWFLLRANVVNSTCNVSAAYNTYTAVQQPNWANKWFPGSLYKVVGIGRINRG